MIWDCCNGPAAGDDMREIYLALHQQQLEQSLLQMCIVGIGAALSYQLINLWPTKLQPYARAGAVVGSALIYVFIFLVAALELEQGFNLSRYLGG